MNSQLSPVRPPSNQGCVGDESGMDQSEEVRAQEEIEADTLNLEEEHFGKRQARVARQPNAPTKAEIDAHYPIHAEYRDWCPHCVAGKAFRTSIGLTPTKNDDDQMCPIIVSYDHRK